MFSEIKINKTKNKIKDANKETENNRVISSTVAEFKEDTVYTLLSLV